MSQWRNCKKVLCIRLDNMGDVLMSAPAMASLKKALGCHITLLASPMGAPIAEYIEAVDEVIVYDVPWVKSEHVLPTDGAFIKLIDEISSRNFDGAVIFTVFSQSPLPAALVVYLAKIPLSLAYCRENPYRLLTDWVPDKEPYDFIQHQVERDLNLIKNVVDIGEETLTIKVPEARWPDLKKKLISRGVDLQKPYIILHPSVSEQKREYSQESWREIGKQLIGSGFQIVWTGNERHTEMLQHLSSELGTGSISLVGALSLDELILLIRHAPLVVTVNTLTVHLSAAMQTPVIVLYAATNPQHTPWRCKSKVFTFPVPDSMQSRNEVLQFVSKHFDIPNAEDATPNRVVGAALKMLL